MLLFTKGKVTEVDSLVLTACPLREILLKAWHFCSPDRLTELSLTSIIYI